MPAGFQGPRLWSPRKFPGRGSLIDWTHPLTRGLAFYSAPGVNLRDFVAGLMGSPYGSAGLGGSGPWGPTLRTTTNSGADGMSWGAGPSAQVQGIGHNFTIYSLMNFAPSGFSNTDIVLAVPWKAGAAGGTTSPFNAIGLYQSGTTGAPILGYTDSTPTHWEATGSTGFYQTTDVWASYAATRAGTAATFYKNGAQQSTASFGADNAVAFSGPAGPVTAFSPNPSAAQWGIKGDAALFAIWSRALSASELLAFNNAPYQFLVDEAPPASVWLMSPTPPVAKTIAQVNGPQGSTQTGNSTQHHVVYAPNSATWWAFWIDPGSTTTLRCAYSSDLLTWTTSTTQAITNGMANSGDGRYLDAYVSSIGTTDVVHVVVSATSQTVYDVRGVLTSNSVTWASPNTVTNAATGTASVPDGIVVTLASDGTLVISSAQVDTAGNFSDMDHTVNATADTTGSSWTPGTWTTVDDKVTAALAVRDHALVPLASGNVLALWPADATPPNNVVYSVISKTSGAVTPANAFGSSSSFSNNTGNEWGVAKVSNTDVHVVRRTGSNTYEHIRYNGSSWSAGQSIPNQNSLAGNGIALTSDGTNVYMAIIDTDANATVRYIVWNGTSWGSWTALEAFPNSTRQSISATQVESGAGFVAFLWTENPSASLYNIRIARISTGSTTPISVSDSATGSDSTIIIGIPQTDSATGSDSVSLGTIAVAVSDSATGSESYLTGIPQTDSGTGSDSVSLGTIAVPVTDSATGTDSYTSTGIPQTDSGSGSDAVSLGTIAVAVSDSATGSDSVSVNQGQTPIPVSDSATGSDSVSLGTITPAPSDTGSGSESESILATLAPTDSASGGAETLGISATVPVSESGSGSESMSGSTTLAPSDSGAGSDGVSVSVAGTHAVSVSDAAAGADAQSTATLISDTASGNPERLTAEPSVLLGGPGLTGSISHERFIITGP